MKLLNYSHPDFEAVFQAFIDEPRGQPANVEARVLQILEAVRRDGAAALVRLGRELDGVDLAESDLQVSSEEIAAGVAACPAPVRAAIEFAAGRILDYHRRQVPEDLRFEDEAGVSLGWKWRPIASVGIYVPGGRAAYPSTVLMNALPAAVAGVRRIVMTTPPGRLDPAVLAAASACGVSEIWRIGGAQAIGALAYGAGLLVPVDKIVGPGNAYVTAAKRRVYGDVGIDGVAGPSEIVVVADDQNDPSWIAADLLSQAEHDPDAQCVLITDTEAFAEAVQSALARHLETLPTAAIARSSWQAHGAVIIAPLDKTASLVNRIAPEHLELAIEECEPMADHIDHAGAIFLGRHTPEAIGDYVAGSNHVLPTNRTARFASGLSVYDFMKRTSVLRCSREGFKQLATHTMALTDIEGLAAHSLSVSVRM